MNVKLKVTGFKEMDRQLKQMKTATAKATVRRAMKVALEPVRAAAASSAPRSGGAGPHMADGIGIAHKLTKRQAREAKRGDGPDLASMYVGAEDPKAHLIEFGTGPRFHKSGKFVGVMPAQPFMRPAWDANHTKVLEILREQMAIEIAKTLDRAAKRAARGG